MRNGSRGRSWYEEDNIENEIRDLATDLLKEKLINIFSIHANNFKNRQEKNNETI